ncbi:hypothetical protein [Roseateles sp.]|uniref:nSTAND1 domain-containing NTPase n=1 Tax=Roseateles sp. TaxID=1971397 RepID=UPI00286A8973|nr:hypothetical protein [Roseateles sp.]
MTRYEKAIHAVRDVFTPSSVASLTFVPRESINNKLVDALSTKGKQVIVYGHSGCGKTTLLENKLAQLFSLHVKTSCMKGMTFEQILADPLRQLKAMYVSEMAAKTTGKFGATLGTPKDIAFPVGFSIEHSQEDAAKTVPIAAASITPQIVAEVLGLNNACWVLEDFHKIDTSEKTKLAQCMKMFMDLSARYPDLKMIFIGAVHTAHKVVEYDPELRNRVAEVSVPLMTEDELRQIIRLGEIALNIRIDQRISDRIVSVSNGLAAVTHQIALNFCHARGIECTQPEILYLDTAKWIPALEKYLESSSDTLRTAFEKSVKDMKKRKYDHGRVILRALTRFSQEGATRIEIFQKIREVEPAYPAAGLLSHLKALQSEARCNILSYDENTGDYAFSEPVHRAFCYMLFESESKANVKVSKEPISVSDFLRQLVPELAEQIARLEQAKNGNGTKTEADRN